MENIAISAPHVEKPNSQETSIVRWQQCDADASWSALSKSRRGKNEPGRLSDDRTVKTEQAM